MFCQKCGKLISDEEYYCPFCGKEMPNRKKLIQQPTDLTIGDCIKNFFV